MLRSLITRSAIASTGATRSLANAVRHNPSTTTSVILSRLPASMIESRLKTELAEINCRKIELEPGCSLFFKNECEARVAAEFLGDKYKAETIVSKASMPCVSLNNIPDNISVEFLEKSFAAESPRTVRITGSKVLQVKVSSDHDALKALNTINALRVEGHKLRAFSTRVTKNHHVLTIFNHSAIANESVVTTAINSALDGAGLSSSAHVDDSTFRSPSVMLRFPSDTKVRTKHVEAALGEGYYVYGKERLRKPTLFLRNIAHLEDLSLDGVLGAHKQHVERVQVLRPNPANQPYMAVVYFRSEEAAFAAAADIHNEIFEGGRVSAVYRESAEPAVKLSHIPEGTTIEDLQELSKQLSYQRIEFTPGDDTAIVVLDTPRDARVARAYYHHRGIGKHGILRAEVHDLCDVGMEVTDFGKGADLSPAAISAALQGAQTQPQSMSCLTHMKAEVGFIGVDEAHNALDLFTTGAVKFPSSAGAEQAGSMVASSISTLPTFVLQLVGLSPETPLSAVVEDVKAGVPGAELLNADRSALIKFRRHRDVVPGMEGIKSLEFEDADVKVERYRPLQRQGDSGYDQVTGKQHKEQLGIMRFSLEVIMKDFMHLDPATRYQIAKNAFIRALFDARATKDISVLFGPVNLFAEDEDEAASEEEEESEGEEGGQGRTGEDYQKKAADPDFDPCFSAEARKEARALFDKTGFAKDLDEAEISSRLFKLYLQKEEMARYAKNFNELRALHGPEDEKKSFNWSNFRINYGTDIDNLLLDMKRAEAEEFSAMVGRARKSKRGDDSESDFDDLSGPVVLSESDAEEGAGHLGGAGAVGGGDEGGEDAKSDQNMSRAEKLKKQMDKLRFLFQDEHGNKLNVIEGPSEQLLDKYGGRWSMVVLDTDTTQKTLPGGRTVTHRALVMMGNLKGAGGFGMGKGTSPSAALDAACREALRKVLHIDRFENAALAHDLYGKHNACHVYIRATPATRTMVGSRMAREVLMRFGLTSASIKIIGNRNPYSQINAIFNALSHHENLDETAKDRGARYLSLRWAHDKRI